MAKAKESAGSVNLDNISNNDIQNAIDTWIHSARDRLILKLRLIDGLTYSQTVEYLYEHEKIVISERQVIRIISKTEDILFKHI